MSTLKQKVITGAVVMSMSAGGLITLAQHEGHRAQPYYDGAKVPTDGFGNTVNVVMGRARGVVQDLKMLYANIRWAEDAVNKHVKTPMSQARFDGLVMFSYNIGETNFRTSSLVRRLNAGDPLACQEIMKWTWITRDKVKLDCKLEDNYKYCGGLIPRRQEEMKLCFTQ